MFYFNYKSCRYIPFLISHAEAILENCFINNKSQIPELHHIIVQGVIAVTQKAMYS